MRQRTPPSELILFSSPVTSVCQGLSLSLRRAGRREPWERGCEVVEYVLRQFKYFFVKTGKVGVCLKMMPHLKARLIQLRLLIAYSQAARVIHATEQKRTL